MKNTLSTRVKSYIREHIREKRWKRVVIVLACAVVFCTTYALILPALTMTDGTFCGKEAHLHTDECYETVLICGKDGASPDASAKPTGHVHTDECSEKKLICTKEEHEHSKQCNSNPDAVEAPAKWTKGLPKLTGNKAKDLVAVAESQLGYAESTACYHVNEDGSVSGYTRYGAWYGGGNDSDLACGDWNASFVAFCLNHAGITADVFPYSAECADWVDRLTESKMYRQASAAPKAGDIVFLNADGDKTAYRVGIVTDVNGDTMRTVEGDLGDRVARSSHKIGSAEVVGYGVLPADAPRRAAAAQTGDARPVITISTANSMSHNDLTFYTGEAANTTLTISNPESAQIDKDDGTVIRVYMQFAKTIPGEGHPASADGTPSYEVDKVYTIKANNSNRQYKFTVTRIDGADGDHYTYCLEFQRPLQGDTISINLPNGYPSPTSAGGTNTVWGAVLTKEEKEALDKDGKPGIAEKPADGENTQTIKWETKPDQFTLKKERDERKWDWAGEADGLLYLQGLSFQVSGVRNEDNTLEGIGKDYVRKLSYKDTITLPEGFSFGEDIVRAIKNGDYVLDLCRNASRPTLGFFPKEASRHYTSDAILGITMPSMKEWYYLSDEFKQSKISLSEDEHSLTCEWYIGPCLWDKSGLPKEEMGTFKATIRYGDRTICANPDQLKPEAEYSIQSVVTRTDSHCWSDGKTLTASCTENIPVGGANLKIIKQRSLRPEFLGENARYEIKVWNDGDLPYRKLAYLRDLLSERLYLSAANLQELFEDTKYGKDVSVKITNATFCESGGSRQVKDMDGNPAGSTASRNTSPDTNEMKYDGMTAYKTCHKENEQGTLTISWNQDKTKLILTGTSEALQNGSETVECTADGIQAALDQLDFLVTNHTQYEITWSHVDENGKPRPLYAGQAIGCKIYFDTTVKDTFMLLDHDQLVRYPSETVEVAVNTVYAEGADFVPGTQTREQLMSREENDKRLLKVKQEFLLDKEVTRGSEDVESVADGDVLDYSLYVAHNGKASYDLLPLTDHMSGTQVLLAEKEKNKNADWAQNCETYTDSAGTEYYLLINAGTYTGVWLNGRYADTVTVSGESVSRDTIIKWYFSNYTGDRNDMVTYRALVCPKKLGNENTSFSIGNESWLNDHQTHRLYDSLRVGGTTFCFEKKIVSAADVSATTKEKGVDECAVSEGQTVYYRFKIYPDLGEEESSSITLTGKDLLDRLPLGFSKDGSDFLRWRRGSKDTQNPGDVWIVKYEGYTDLKNADSWSITEDGTTDQQRITWDDSFSVTIGNKPLYIYVRVTFPSGADWQEYAAQYANTTLINTLYIYGIADSVTHTLSIPAEAYLQKGVYSTVGVPMLLYTYDTAIPQDNDALFYYSNNDAYLRYVNYYVLVYNDGLTRLYLKDLQDVLPQGFTFSTMVESAYATLNRLEETRKAASTVTLDYAPLVRSGDGRKIEWLNATVTADSSRTGFITFSISEGKEEEENKIPINYDKTRKLYYLNPNQGIKFLYRCATNDRDKTRDVAVNSIAMPYYDFNHGGLKVSQVRFTRHKSPSTADLEYQPNDGRCSIIDNTQAKASGRTGGDNDTQWLYSSVEQVRGEIKPGITKKLTAAVSTSGAETKDPLTAHPTDTLRWEVTAANDGKYPIYDYVLSDTMQEPYLFEGKFTYQVVSDQVFPESWFSLSAPDAEGQVTVKYEGDFNPSITLKVNGDPVKVPACSVRENKVWRRLEFYLQITQDATSGKYTLSLRFTDPRFGIPAGGTATLTLKTKRPDDGLENKVFVNSCFITPMSQTWDNTTNKGNMTTLNDVFGEDNKPTVRNSASVTTAYGYVTSSLKSVEEKVNPSNKATCNESPNYIVLPGKDSLFTYTLTVDAPDERAMDKLILIDGLPQVGDHSCFQIDDPRFSEFKVAFAETPNVTVTVTKDDGSVMELAPGQFKVEYSTKTVFTKADWEGSSAWNDSPAGARSMRITILDNTGALIPAKSHISVRFDAKIEGDAKPGQIAWNSFGYHYSVLDDENELEAAPLKVGVMLPAVPQLVKKLVDDDGNPAKALADRTFRFLIYTGSSLKETDEAKLAEALKSNGRKATLVEMKVEAGKSASVVRMLSDLYVYAYENGKWTKTQDSWIWNSGSYYTLLELDDGDPLYRFSSINRRTNADGYTFYYQNDQTLVLSAVNLLDVWSFTIKKTDAVDGSTLTGAWFALYSPEQSDRMTRDAYNALSDKPKKQPDFMLEQDGKTWYLTSVGQTRDMEGKNGTLVWGDLLRDEYLYREIQAPMGYKLDDTVHYAKKADVAHTVTITNIGAGVELPETGAAGTALFTMGGIALMAIACLLGYYLLRRRVRRRVK